MKRRPILILEMMIALIIMSIVLGLLFTGFYGAIQLKNKLRSKKENIFNLQRCKLRLEGIFKNMIDVKKKNNLYYIHHRGALDHDPDFRLEVESLLFVKNNRLTLITWSPEGKVRQEIIGESMENVEIKFFDEKKGSFELDFPACKVHLIKVVINKSQEIPLFL